MKGFLGHLRHFRQPGRLPVNALSVSAHPQIAVGGFGQGTQLAFGGTFQRMINGQPLRPDPAQATRLAARPEKLGIGKQRQHRIIRQAILPAQGVEPAILQIINALIQ